MNGVAPTPGLSNTTNHSLGLSYRLTISRIPGSPPLLTSSLPPAPSLPHQITDGRVQKSYIQCEAGYCNPDSATTTCIDETMAYDEWPVEYVREAGARRGQSPNRGRLTRVTFRACPAR